jgi:hypothetical protein
MSNQESRSFDILVRYFDVVKRKLFSKSAKFADENAPYLAAADHRAPSPRFVASLDCLSTEMGRTKGVGRTTRLTSGLARCWTISRQARFGGLDPTNENVPALVGLARENAAIDAAARARKRKLISSPS